MAEKIYTIVNTFIPRYPNNDKMVFYDKNLRAREIFRGLAKDWKGFANDGFDEFLKINNISEETTIAVAQDGSDTLAVIQIIDF